MEIRPDRSGAAFGYCLLCSQQLRVGGQRDAAFRENWGLPAGNDAPVTVTGTDSIAGDSGESGDGPAVEAGPPAATVPETVPAAPPKKKRATCLLDA